MWAGSHGKSQLQQRRQQHCRAACMQRLHKGSRPAPRQTSPGLPLQTCGRAMGRGCHCPTPSVSTTHCEPGGSSAQGRSTQSCALQELGNTRALPARLIQTNRPALGHTHVRRRQQDLWVHQGGSTKLLVHLLLIVKPQLRHPRVSVLLRGMAANDGWLRPAACCWCCRYCRCRAHGGCGRVAGGSAFQPAAG